MVTSRRRSRLQPDSSSWFVGGSLTIAFVAAIFNLWLSAASAGTLTPGIRPGSTTASLGIMRAEHLRYLEALGQSSTVSELMDSAHDALIDALGDSGSPDERGSLPELMDTAHEALLGALGQRSDSTSGLPDDSQLDTVEDEPATAEELQDAAAQAADPFGLLEEAHSEANEGAGDDTSGNDSGGNDSGQSSESGTEDGGGQE